MENEYRDAPPRYELVIQLSTKSTLGCSSEAVPWLGGILRCRPSRTLLQGLPCGQGCISK